jgi:hypothetical protein
MQTHRLRPDLRTSTPHPASNRFADRAIVQCDERNGKGASIGEGAVDKRLCVRYGCNRPRVPRMDAAREVDRDASYRRNRPDVRSAAATLAAASEEVGRIK